MIPKGECDFAQVVYKPTKVQDHGYLQCLAAAAGGDSSCTFGSSPRTQQQIDHIVNTQGR